MAHLGGWGWGDGGVAADVSQAQQPVVKKDSVLRAGKGVAECECCLCDWASDRRRFRGHAFVVVGGGGAEPQPSDGL